MQGKMIKFSKNGGTLITTVLLIIIVGAILRLIGFAPYGSLGSLDGQSFEVDRFSIIGYIIFPLVIGIFIIRKRSNRS